MNRRKFLTAGTAAAATTWTARSYAAIAGANGRMNLGLIGLGRRATEVTAAFLADPRVRVASVCDCYTAHTEQFIARLLRNAPAPKTSVDYHDLLADRDLDAVMISTPDHLHVTIAQAALAAGKNTYLEKPTLHHWNERQALLDAEARSGKIVQCGMQQRSGSHYARALEEVFGPGKLGSVVLVRGVWHDFPWQCRKIVNEPKPPGLHWQLFEGPAKHVPYATIRYSSWRYFPDYGNGLLADIMTHWVDVAQWMMSDAEPQTAAALGGIYKLHDGRVNPDTVSAVVQYRAWNFNFESSVLPIRNPHPTVLFEGTEATLDLSRDGYTLQPNRGAPVRVDATERLELSHTRNFTNAVLGKGKVNAPIRAGIQASLPVQMALKSYWSRQFATAAELG